jgi:hypothetical protein
MKKTFVISCMLVLSCAAFGQQIKSKNVELDDIISLLNASGYELFSFDVTEMLKERYDITFIQKEYEAGREIVSSNITQVPNKMLLTDFPESQWQEALDAGITIIDPETKAIAHAEKFSFGFYPSGNDSTKFMQIDIPNFMRNRTPFKLRGITTKDSDKLSFLYSTRPFKLNTFKEDEFIPLVLFGSMWYDERFNIFRFCGEAEINPDMSSEILKDVPHHYVIGVKFVKR